MAICGAGDRCIAPLAGICKGYLCWGRREATTIGHCKMLVPINPFKMSFAGAVRSKTQTMATTQRGNLRLQGTHYNHQMIVTKIICWQFSLKPYEATKMRNIRKICYHKTKIRSVNEPHPTWYTK